MEVTVTGDMVTSDGKSARHPDRPHRIHPMLGLMSYISTLRSTRSVLADYQGLLPVTRHPPRAFVT